MMILKIVIACRYVDGDNHRNWPHENGRERAVCVAAGAAAGAVVEGAVVGVAIAAALGSGLTCSGESDRGSGESDGGSSGGRLARRYEQSAHVPTDKTSASKTTPIPKMPFTSQRSQPFMPMCHWGLHWPQRSPIVPFAHDSLPDTVPPRHDRAYGQRLGTHQVSGL
jgi:hypothetical protein